MAYGRNLVASSSVGEQVRIEVVHVRGDHTAEQDAAEAGRRIGREHALAERQATSG